MKIFSNPALILGLFVWIPVTYSLSTDAPEDQDTSGDDEESSGSGLAEYEPAWITDAPVTLSEQTTKIQIIMITPHAPSTVSQPMLTTTQQVISEHDAWQEETTTVSLMVAEETTSGTTVSVVKEDNRPAVSIKVNDKTTSVPHMETTLVQKTSVADVVNPEREASGDGAMSTTLLTTTEGRELIPPSFEDNYITEDRTKDENSELDSDFHFDNEIIPRRIEPVNDAGIAQGATSENESLLERKEVLAGVIAGGLVGLIFAVMLVALMIYRMKKKDEGSYALEEHKPPKGYQKPHKQVEFFA
ncbi:syndecan-1-like [Myxocyprinus asiaticus]|uniref:syndecan-1-like n=1 Tax=Myxocyprinus asiaticus TaxID=70543 RepID=UPI0022214E56|nr:syndecan-1-like [Myxocyprinus asiaticus]